MGFYQSTINLLFDKKRGDYLNNNKHTITVKENLNKEDYEAIEKLQKLCVAKDEIALKLELEYKLARTLVETDSTLKSNEFFYYIGANLVGYIGIGCFSGATLEINGMVHPEYRRQGIFSKLFQLVKQEWEKRGGHQMLLLSDRISHSGQEFIKKTQATYKNSEYEMYLNMNFISETTEGLTQEIVLRKASNKDAEEIARQNAIFFDDDYDESINMIMPEEEEKCGMTIYLVEVDDKIVGKVHLQIENDLGAIYGLGVLPDHRSQGYGRKILLKAIDAFKEIGVKKIMLQVATQNANALNLYKSCGFEETSTMDYYELR